MTGATGATGAATGGTIGVLATGGAGGATCTSGCTGGGTGGREGITGGADTGTGEIPPAELPDAGGVIPARPWVADCPRPAVNESPTVVTGWAELRFTDGIDVVDCEFMMKSASKPSPAAPRPRYSGKRLAGGGASSPKSFSSVVADELADEMADEMATCPRLTALDPCA